MTEEVRNISRLSVVALILAAACVIWISLVGNAETHGTLTTKSRLGADAPTAPFAFSDAVARCPRGYVATGGGSYAGAIEHVTDGPTADGKGWEVSGFNSSDSQVYSHNAIVSCIKGSRRNKVRAALSEREKKEARQQFLEARNR